MKRRILPLMLALFVILGILAGCSAKSVTGDYAPGAAGEIADGLNGSGSPNFSDSDVLTDRKLIRKINLTAETEDMDALLSQINQRVSQLEGYIEARNIYNGSAYSGKVRRNATLTIRIPADRLDQFVEQLGGISNIISNEETSDDVTLQYTATESRLKVLKAEEERLLAFMAEAKSVSEMLEIEQRLTEVQAELESLTSQLNVYDNLVDYGTVNLRISEVERYTELVTEEPTLWEQIADGFTGSLRNMGNILKTLFVFTITVIPYLIPLAVVGGIVLLVLKLRKRKK